ncbi:hypothetical protein JL722_11056 [Aureococcus anophagefferens]|nr:hypothetical protein JL722_11056 [Aureococcus anophagefferens]
MESFRRGRRSPSREKAASTPTTTGAASGAYAPGRARSGRRGAAAAAAAEPPPPRDGRATVDLYRVSSRPRSLDERDEPSRVPSPRATRPPPPADRPAPPTAPAKAAVDLAYEAADEGGGREFLPWRRPSPPAS